MIQISDFLLHNLFSQEGDKCGNVDVDDFLGKPLARKVDVQAFTTIFSEIVFGASSERSGDAEAVPSFVSEIIEIGQCTDLIELDPFTYILSLLKGDEFEIVEGVDVDEVTKFVSLIESSETLTE
jgi:hypothetical protein